MQCGVNTVQHVTTPWRRSGSLKSLCFGEMIKHSSSKEISDSTRGISQPETGCSENILLFKAGRKSCYSQQERARDF